MIAQIKRDEKIVAEILVVGPRVSTKIIEQSPRLDSYIRYLLENSFLVCDPEGLTDPGYSKVGEKSDAISFSILASFGQLPEFSLEILNPPKIKNPKYEKDLVY